MVATPGTYRVISPTRIEQVAETSETKTVHVSVCPAFLYSDDETKTRERITGLVDSLRIGVERMAMNLIRQGRTPIVEATSRDLASRLTTPNTYAVVAQNDDLLDLISNFDCGIQRITLNETRENEVLDPTEAMTVSAISIGDFHRTRVYKGPPAQLKEDRYPDIERTAKYVAFRFSMGFSLTLAGVGYEYGYLDASL
ncbi:hypothetical protein BcepSauron_111 [Burkholderia phage BcepSauron]|uniref:Uncharacterized protein n=1 Tax=Burkholderia phage BcepSauron TaxID=2530033 RepID=A0A482MKD0_9CAUD|nr:hypothetical protein H1O17_gp111 [Burkholderia phage BcepSauron]QBQ74491.1 hypothetical protein BcepSauron_111 [Burkholderia phage BcepSauron]